MLAVKGGLGVRSQMRGPSRCGRLGDPTALASAPQRLRTVPRAPSLSRPARPEALARRRGRNSSHFLCAARYVACLLPDRRAARGGGQAARASPSHVWQLPRPRRPPRDSPPAAPRPGRPNWPFQQPRACLASPGSDSSPRGCRRHRCPLRAPARPLPPLPPQSPPCPLPGHCRPLEVPRIRV